MTGKQDGPWSKFWSDFQEWVEKSPSYARMESLMDVKRIQEEGPTLKFVTESMRSLAACVVFIAGFAQLLRDDNWAGRSYFEIAFEVGVGIVAMAWIGWAGFYGLLAVFQLAMLLASSVVSVIADFVGKQPDDPKLFPIFYLLVPVLWLATIGAITMTLIGINQAIHRA
jgi:hypothetical protein